MDFIEEYKKAKQFVKEHQVQTTAVVGFVAGVAATLYCVRPVATVELAKKFAYEKGVEVGDVQARLEYLQKDWDDAFQYLKENELMNDFADWAGWTVVTEEIHKEHFPSAK